MSLSSILDPASQDDNWKALYVNTVNTNVLNADTLNVDNLTVDTLTAHTVITTDETVDDLSADIMTANTALIKTLSLPSAAFRTDFPNPGVTFNAPYPSWTLVSTGGTAFGGDPNYFSVDQSRGAIVILQPGTYQIKFNLYYDTVITQSNYIQFVYLINGVTPPPGNRPKSSALGSGFSQTFSAELTDECVCAANDEIGIYGSPQSAPAIINNGFWKLTVVRLNVVTV